MCEPKSPHELTWIFTIFNFCSVFWLWIVLLWNLFKVQLELNAHMMVSLENIHSKTSIHCISWFFCKVHLNHFDIRNWINIFGIILKLVIFHLILLYFLFLNALLYHYSDEWVACFEDSADLTGWKDHCFNKHFVQPWLIPFFTKHLLSYLWICHILVNLFWKLFVQGQSRWFFLVFTASKRNNIYIHTIWITFFIIWNSLW